MKKKTKKDETDLFLQYAREFCKEVKSQGKIGKEIAQAAISIASVYWVCRLCSNYPDIPGLQKKISHDPVSWWGNKIEHILKRSGLSLQKIA